MTSSESRGVMSGSINNEYSSFPNMIRFQLGKRKKEFKASEGDEFIIGNADEARTGCNGTPTGNKKIKLLKMSPASLQPNADVQSYKTNTRISGIKEGIHLKRSGTENLMNEEKVYVGGSLHMLVDAIQQIEGQRLHIIVDQLAKAKDLISVLPENFIEDMNHLGRPSFQNQLFRANDCLEASSKVFLDGEPSDTGNNCKRISKGVDIDSRAMLRTRSRGGWLPTLPSKYSESVLQPWKKVTKKCPNLLEG